MAFLANKTVNRLHLHSAIYVLASAGGGVFFGAFLLKAGVPIPSVLCAFALINLGRFCLRPLVLMAAKRVGLQPLVVLGTVLLALQYPVLAQVHGVGWALLALCAVATLGETFYWTAYHTYYGQVGDAEHRGHQTSAREAVAALVGIVAPVAGGWALATLGPQAAFGAVAVVQTLAVLPLLGMPNVEVPREVEAAYVGVEPGFWMYLWNGWIGAGTAVVLAGRALRLTQPEFHGVWRRDGAGGAGLGGAGSGAGTAAGRRKGGARSLAVIRRPDGDDPPAQRRGYARPGGGGQCGRERSWRRSTTPRT